MLPRRASQNSEALAQAAPTTAAASVQPTDPAPENTAFSRSGSMPGTGALIASSMPMFNRRTRLSRLVLLVTGAVALACSAPSADEPSGPAEGPVEPGVEVTPQLSESDQAELDGLSAQFEEVEGLDYAGLQSRYPSGAAAQLGYDPSQSVGLSTIQASALSLNSSELERLNDTGFAIAKNRQFPGFLYGYHSVYLEDLPVYVTADALMHAVHRSFDDILSDVESSMLIPELATMLNDMRTQLAKRPQTAATQDADFYLTVAAALLTGKQQTPHFKDQQGQVDAFVADATEATTGISARTLFGVNRRFDFSQFKPRGHYTDSPALSNYFRAMMWLGRIDFRLIETQDDGSQVFHRRQLEAAVTLQELMTKDATHSWQRLEQVISGFVGEADSMTLPELNAYLDDVDVSSAEQLANKTDTELAQAILDGGYGTQRISSHIMINGAPGGGTLPLSSTFLLFGQRYVLDSHVFSNVVYDRVQRGKVKRMMPSTLDVAFAALGNNDAIQLLQPELKQFNYAEDLARVRILADNHPDAYWSANVYNTWLSSLRALSPTNDSDELAALPSVTRSDAWGRRILNAQLGSWAELRHDTILYAKQSYTGGASCEYPDAYVDPYPAFYARVAQLAETAETVLSGIGFKRGVEYFQHLGSVATTLQGMAEYQRAGTPYDAEQLAFINDAVQVEDGCGGIASANGWYAKLFYDARGYEWDPTIADVHTQPTDEAGAPVGRVLHVGTAAPRLMVTTIETCSGPRAYAGIVSSYHEVVTENFERLDDLQWKIRAWDEQSEPTWMQPLLAE